MSYPLLPNLYTLSGGAFAEQIIWYECILKGGVQDTLKFLCLTLMSKGETIHVNDILPSMPKGEIVGNMANSRDDAEC